MSIDVYVPRDASALSLGAEGVARAIEEEARAQRSQVRLIRNGSRGLYWLEPMVEVALPHGRWAYGPVKREDVASLFAADFLQGGAHPLSQGPTEEIPYLKSQQRLTSARVGVIEPTSIADYVAHGGYLGLQRALAMTQPERCV